MANTVVHLHDAQASALGRSVRMVHGRTEFAAADPRAPLLPLDEQGRGELRGLLTDA